ncbi:MAG: site-specific DNA-methyltransferase [Candidatus Kapabacteria bacterium]|nr:site-specific DNA-methyltransferase [Candidatus Kapabacteria bacterium]
MFYNENCISGARNYIKDNSIDLIISDPPYGIDGDLLDKHYNRDESNVIDGYVEVAAAEYPQFSKDWIKEAERVLRPGGSIYIISGYTNLRHVLNALAETKLQEVNHIIWRYNFGVYTRKKYISSHYHILYFVKPGGEITFNRNSFYSDDEKTSAGLSANAADREDVWNINREYKPGEIKNKNQLPEKLLRKMILYSSNPENLVCDFFLGSFSTAKVAIGLGRNACGFELNKAAFEYQSEQVAKITKGELLSTLRNVPENKNINTGKKLTDAERETIISMYNKYIQNGYTKKAGIEKISEALGRGRFSIANIVSDADIAAQAEPQNSLF